MTQLRKRLLTSALVFLAVSATSNASADHDPLGFWKSEDSRAKVKFGPCDNDASKICGKIVELKWPTDPVTQKPKLDKHNPDASLQTRPLMGLEIVRDFHKDDEPNKWTGGTIYSPREGKTYTAEFTMPDNGTLKVRGYVFIPLLGKTQVWTRTDEATPLNPENTPESTDSK